MQSTKFIDYSKQALKKPWYCFWPFFAHQLRQQKYKEGVKGNGCICEYSHVVIKMHFVIE